MRGLFELAAQFHEKPQHQWSHHHHGDIRTCCRIPPASPPWRGLWFFWWAPWPGRAVGFGRYWRWACPPTRASVTAAATTPLSTITAPAISSPWVSQNPTLEKKRKKPSHLDAFCQIAFEWCFWWRRWFCEMLTDGHGTQWMRLTRRESLTSWRMNALSRLVNWMLWH